MWDGLFLGAGELLMRQPGIVGLHTLTTLNAMHYCARTTGDADLRKLLLLQAASFLPMFRDAMKARGKVGDDSKNDEGAGQGVHGAGCVYSELGRNKEGAYPHRR